MFVQKHCLFQLFLRRSSKVILFFFIFLPFLSFYFFVKGNVLNSSVSGLEPVWDYGCHPSPYPLDNYIISDFYKFVNTFFNFFRLVSRVMSRGNQNFFRIILHRPLTFKKWLRTCRRPFSLLTIIV